MPRPVGPDEDGRVLLKRSEAAWLARVSTETIRRWIDDERTLAVVGEGASARVLWDDLCVRAANAGDSPPAHWSWLNADMSRPADRSEVGSSDAGPNGGAALPPPDEVSQLRALNETLRMERDTALAEAENLDQAVMIYRDNWRRRTQPQSPVDLATD